MLSVITTLYHSAEYIRDFHARLLLAIENSGIEKYELIFVNDGSPDDSLSIVRLLQRTYENIKIIDLSRNFGQHQAIFCGLRASQGEMVFLIDVDLEEDPEYLSDFLKELSSCPETDVIYGVQKKRKGKLFERISGKLFYSIFNFLSPVKITQNLSTMRLMTRRYVDAVCLYREHDLVFDGVFFDVGFTQKPFYINKHSSSPTTYSLQKKLDLSFHALTSFSDTPLRMIFFLGILVTGLSFVLLALIVLQRIIYATPMLGWASLMAAIIFFGGLTIFSVGLVGLYVGRTFIQSKNRPYPVIRNIEE